LSPCADEADYLDPHIQAHRHTMSTHTNANVDYSVYDAIAESYGHELDEFVQRGKLHTALCKRCGALAQIREGELPTGRALKATCMGYPVTEQPAQWIPSPSYVKEARQAEAARKRERAERRREQDRLSEVCDHCGSGYTLAGRGCRHCKVGNYGMLEQTSRHIPLTRKATPSQEAPSKRARQYAQNDTPLRAKRK
jgi:ribosomal protein L40E